MKQNLLQTLKATASHNITQNKKLMLPVLGSILLAFVLWLLPTGYEGAQIYQEADRCRAVVTAVDNSSIIDTGLVRSGEQRCTMTLETGLFAGQTVTGVNMLSGSLEADKIFVEGDRAQVVVSYSGDEILTVSMTDHFRLWQEGALAGLFILLLLAFAGMAGVRAILSFALTVLMLWKVLVPCYLNGWNPVLTGILLVLALTVVIILLVYGWERRTAAAVFGAFLGILTTALTGAIFTSAFKIHGAVMPYSESLLYSGYQHLNLTQIFMASIFIGASGAVMDLAVDITSAVYEVVQKKPDITWQEATHSGLNVGRAAMGTMTTTLLLAYSGGYIALLMVFMAQGTPIELILNYKYVSAEILDTMVGSMGLVTVAPFTALTSGLLLCKRTR